MPDNCLASVLDVGGWLSKADRIQLFQMRLESLHYCKEFAAERPEGVQDEFWSKKALEAQGHNCSSQRDKVAD